MADFTFPDSVRAYLTDLEVQAAVDALVGKTLERTPPVDWLQLPDYYAATLAALQVQVDWARSLALLWEAAWADRPAALTPLTPSEQVRDAWVSNSVTSCWDEDGFVRAFRSGGDYVSLAVSFDRSDLFVGFGVTTRQAKGWKDYDLSAPGYEALEDGILWSPAGAIPYRGAVPHSEIRAAATALLKIAHAALPHLPF